jgi:hypothetical protein
LSREELVLHGVNQLAAAHTNEERFIASCNKVGEADVRQKLSAGQYSERRASWASGWLEQFENGKSDATKTEERNSRLVKSSSPRFAKVTTAILVMLLGGVGSAVWLL